MDQYYELNDKLKGKLSKYGDRSRFLNAIQLMQNVSTTLPKLKRVISEDVVTPKKLLLKRLAPDSHFLPNIDKTNNRPPLYQNARNTKPKYPRVLKVSPKVRQTGDTKTHHTINPQRQKKGNYSQYRRGPTVEYQHKAKYSRASSVTSSSCSSSDLEDCFLNGDF